MKKKYFFEPMIMYLGCIPIFHIFPYIGVPLCIWYLATEGPTSSSVFDIVKYIFGIVLLIVMLIGIIWLNITTFDPRIDYLVVAEDYVEWHGLFRRKKRLYYRDCRFIDIETFNKEAQCPIIRGDECAMVYLSTEPFPEEMSGRINHVYCSDKFIKFRYTDKLAEALLEVIPEGRSRMLRAFYHQMKSFDENMERLRKARKAKARQKARARKMRR